MPPNVSALVLRAPPGGELTCRARSVPVDDGGKARERGLVSYYAIRALADATTMESWRTRIERLFQEDLAAGRISADLALSLQVAGDPGHAVFAASEPDRNPREAGSSKRR